MSYINNMRNQIFKTNSNKFNRSNSFNEDILNNIFNNIYHNSIIMSKLSFL